jgi:anti-sigma B factor antagonist
LARSTDRASGPRADPARLRLVRWPTQPDPPGPTLLLIDGEVDLAVADELGEAAEAALVDSGGRGVILDLSGVTFLDSTGLGALVGIRNSLVQRDASLVLLRPSEPVTRLLQITGLVDVFAIEAGPGPDAG